jgi:molybdopterin-guanine dinucleotide biosynthesis protein A
MGAVDKGLQILAGQPMTLHVLQRLQPQVKRVLINANQNLASYEAFGTPVFPDVIEGFAGPLAGLQTGLMHCKTPYLVTAPCDSPFVPTDLVQRLQDALLTQVADVAVAVTGQGTNRQVHPVFCLMRVAVLPHLTAFLQAGGRKVGAWHASLKVAEVHFADDRAFSNINTQDELRQCESASWEAPSSRLRWSR